MSPVPSSQTSSASAPASLTEVEEETVVALEKQVGILMRRARRVVADRAHLVHPELTVTGYLMMVVLVDEGALRPSAISDLYVLDKGAVSRQVQQLVDLGMVSRDRDPVDGRATILSVTHQGKAAMVRVRDHRRATLRERLGEWEDEDLQVFVTGMRRYNETLERA